MDLLFKIYRIVGRTLIRYSGNPRPGSAPFITGDGFRALADHIYDAARPHLDAGAVRTGEIVFVGDSRIETFLIQIHPHITTQYVLVTHNGDQEVDARLLALADEKILRWYGINVVIDHPKVTPLPLGIENKHYYVCGIPTVFRHVARQKYQKNDKIFYGFTVSTNPIERQPALDTIAKHPLGETLPSWKNYFSYLHTLARYKFVLSPPGSSIEGHRTWDAMYTGVVPIVKRSVTTSYFEKIGVPLLCITDWKELNGFDAQRLADTYAAVHAQANPQSLSMEYWTNKIKNLEY